MKAILEFNLDDPSDREAHARAIKSTDLALILWDLQQEVFRKARKYGELNGEKLTEEQQQIIEQVSEQFEQMMAERNISLDEILS